MRRQPGWAVVRLVIVQVCNYEFCLFIGWDDPRRPRQWSGGTIAAQLQRRVMALVIAADLGVRRGAGRRCGIVTRTAQHVKAVIEAPQGDVADTK